MSLGEITAAFQRGSVGDYEGLISGTAVQQLICPPLIPFRIFLGLCEGSKKNSTPSITQSLSRAQCFSRLLLIREATN